uniref:Uncharacterized protein LOC105057859 isoform X4 n=1 Tax=Elaeis guineensis var. tenera TaxID=51953 RepID=A0A8N4IBR3_ELAGV|nr:uncharacterized protein LOC105057859 isoform X4 [Elaeis guineensis]
MIDTISAGPTTVFLIGSHTNFALFLMTNPHLKKYIQHIYIMGGGVRSKDRCPNNSSTSCIPQQCADCGNLVDAYASNPYAEFNIFEDPFAAYQVFHSGIPITLVPLDATNTIPINEQFFMAFEQQQDTYEAQYCFQSLKSIHDTHSDNQFYMNFYMWDSFTAGVAVSIMRNADNFNGENEFAEMEYLNLTVVTSNKPYGIYDGSNPFFDGRAIPKFSLQKDGVHSGHVQTGLQDPFCFVPGSNKGKCKDGYTKEVTVSEGVRVLVAKKAKPNQDVQSPLNREFFKCFLDGILVSGNGWANAATVDVIYDVLHMMGRDDILVGLGNINALGTPSLGCKYVNAIPLGSGGLLDSDTLYGLARTLPRSPRRYTADKSVKFGAPRNTDHPELRQPLAMEVWQSITRALNPNDKIMVLTNGPLTNLANIILSDKNASSVIQNVYVVGGHILDECDEKGSVFTVPSNKYAEFNMFLDPVAAKKVIESDLPITFIPLSAQRKVSSFESILKHLKLAGKTPEALFAYHLLSLMQELQQQHQAYHHMDIFLGEILGAVFLVDGPNLNLTMQKKPVSVLAGDTSKDGQTVINKKYGKFISLLNNFDREAYYRHLANLLGDRRQSAVIGSFDEQKKKWSIPPNET